MRYRFGEFELDLKLYELRRGGASQPVEPQVFDVLAHLVRHRDRVVSKEELLDEVWGDRFVSESALTSRIKAARQAVGDNGRIQLLIRTVHGRGYRFVADVVEDDPGIADPRVASVGGSSGLVERDPQLVQLRAALAAAVSERRGSVVLLSGEAGVGKSALVGAFLDAAEAVAVTLVGGCDDMITPRVLGPPRVSWPTPALRSPKPSAAVCSAATPPTCGSGTSWPGEPSRRRRPRWNGCVPTGSWWSCWRRTMTSNATVSCTMPPAPTMSTACSAMVHRRRSKRPGSGHTVRRSSSPGSCWRLPTVFRWPRSPP